MAGYYQWQTYEFDEERDLNPYFQYWLLEGVFCIPALKPFCLWLAQVPGTSWCIARAAEELSMPTAMGMEGRLKDGYWYISVIEVPEEEWKQREPKFREKMAPWIEDFEREWRGRLVPKLTESYERLKKVDVAKLSDVGLWDHFDDWMSVYYAMWLIHFQSLFPAYSLYGLFEDMCKELLGIDGTDPQFKTLMGGFDNKMQELERELWRLGERVKELRLEQTFQSIPDDEELLSKLKESEAGRNWLKELHDFLQEYGWRCPPVVRINEPSWIEKPSLAVPDIRRAIAKGAVFALDQERKRLVEERENAEKDILSRVPVERRNMFEKLMRGAQWCSRWSEDHVFYCESYALALGRRVLMEMARRYARAGVLDEPEDILFLVPDEIRLPAITMHRCPMKKLARIRKEQWQEFLKQEPPVFIGDPSSLARQAAVNPGLRIIAALPIVKPELKADLYGSGSAAGVVEGTARVLMSEAEFSQLQPGEILVSPFTHSDWTPLFWLAKGAVTDHGGALAHAVIVGREYGIPVVAGTWEATKKIKTGDRIRVDGDMGAVYILPKT
ncbi:MAG: phosphoenolpyruvate-utilizing protein [Chloroflexi bacterium]|nr:phosphoenolpyruvate-utilizing protein [Chloroflexota bacterium]